MKRSRRLTIANIDFETTVRWQSNVDDDRQFLIGVASVMKRTVYIYISKSNTKSQLMNVVVPA